MGAMVSQITSLTIVYSTVYSGADKKKHQSSASLSFMRRIHRSPVNSPPKWPVTRKMFPFDDVVINVMRHNISWDLPLLTHLPLDKMTTIFAGEIFKCISMNEKFSISIRMLLKFVPGGPIDSKWALVQVMASRQICDKPLPESMMIHFTDAYMQH